MLGLKTMKMILGCILIGLSSLSVVKPHKTLEVYLRLNRHNPILKHEKPHATRPMFMICFGIAQIFVGLCVILFGP